MGRADFLGDIPRSPHRPSRAVAVGGAIAAAVLLAGCSAPTKGGTSAGGHDQHGGLNPDAPKAVQLSIEQLASKLGCSPQGERKSADFRQANCNTGNGRYAMATFTTEQGKTAWLTEAKYWGGMYLVGPKWAISASNEPILQGLQSKVGGEIQAGDHHM